MKQTIGLALALGLTLFSANGSSQTTIWVDPVAGPICAGPLGPSPCNQFQNYIQNQIINSGSSIKDLDSQIRIRLLNLAEPRIAPLGSPVRFIFSERVAAQGLLLLNARIIHAGGTSEWRLGLLPNGTIATMELTRMQVSGGSAPWGNGVGPTSGPLINGSGSTNTGWAGPGNLAGDSSHGLHNSGQIISGSSSVWNGPGQISNPGTGINAQLNQPQIIAPPSPPKVDNRVVEFLFATTRKQNGQESPGKAIYGAERDNLSYGAASVRIPEDHKIGRIELPNSWRIFGISLNTTPNDREHFVIKSAGSLSESQFGDIVKSKNSKAALVFVHGFNNTFEDSLLRHAQIVWDLQFQGVSVLFSWASKGNVTDYIYDKDSAFHARSSFLSLIKNLRQKYDIEDVIIIAHSMGNLIALDALAGYAQTNNPVTIARLLMAAPDVDRDLYLDLAPKAKAIVKGMTLYASSADKTLILSRQLAGGVPRAGDVAPSGPVLSDGVESIDVTAVGEDILGLNHNVFAASRDVMEDIAAMIRLNRPPPRLIQIRQVPDPPSAAMFWRYVR